MTTTAIIGAGPAGLVAAKSALEQGLRPTVFEAANDLGGLWRPGAGAIWPTLRTNLSKHSCCFSDFPHPKSALEFPNCREIQSYLSSYSREFKLEGLINYQSPISSAEFNGSNWNIGIKEKSGQVKFQEFKNLIVASGFFTKGVIPDDIKGLNDFSGEKIHSSQVSDFEHFRDKNVVIWGNGFSGIELASEIAHFASRVTHVIRRPSWVLPRFVYDYGHNQISPIDICLYRRSDGKNKPTSREQAYQARNMLLSTFTQQNEIAERTLGINPVSKEFHPVAISDNYVKQVASGEIQVERLRPESYLFGNSINLTDSYSINADIIVFATGFKFELPFFDNQIKSEMKFEPDDQFQPAILYKSTLLRALPSLSFVGTYKGPYFGIMELQARLASSALLEQRLPVSHREYDIDITNEIAIRNLNPRPQFPRSDYVRFANELAALCGCLPDLEEGDKLSRLVSKGPVIPAHYRLVGPNSKRDVAESTILDLNETYPV